MHVTIKSLVILMIVLVVGILIGLSIPGLQQRNEDFSRYAQARDAAEDKEEFDRNFDNMVKWFDDYKRNNPGATNEDAQRAFNELWGNQ